MKQEAKLGVLSGMGRPTRLPPRGDPGDFKPLGANELPRQRIFGLWPKMGPMPVCSDRRQIYV